MRDRAKRDRTKKSKGKKALKVFGITLLIIILLVAGIALGGYLYLKMTVGKVNYDDSIDRTTIEINEGVKEKLKGYRVIALFGVDSRSGKIETNTRTDCIILAIINENTKKVKLVSVYRDTFLKLTGRDLDKITHAYAYGGPKLSMDSLNTNLDLNITEYATVNFNSLIDIVDAIDGITITIEDDEVKYLNMYVQDMHDEIKTPLKKISGAGTQNLCGVQALAYSRIRYTSGGDYERNERMRTVLMAIVEKAKGMGIGSLNNLANKILPKVYTNISADEIISLLPQIATYSFSDSIGWPFETKGDSSVPGRGNTWYGIPVTLESNVKRLHEEVLEQTNYEVSDTVKGISDSIVNKTGYK